MRLQHIFSSKVNSPLKTRVDLRCQSKFPLKLLERRVAFAESDLGGVDWVASHPPFGVAKKKGIL